MKRGIRLKGKVKLTFFEDYSNDCVTLEEGTVVEGVVKMDEGSWIVEEGDCKTWYPLFQVLEYCEIEIV